MGTRSAIGYRLPDGSIKAVYCHWDGYPEHQKPILEEHYNTLAKVKALIKPGSMSSLRSTHTWESDPIPDPDPSKFAYLKDDNGHTLYSHLRDPQPLYHCERGPGPHCPAGEIYADPPAVSADLSTANRHWGEGGCEWLYVYVPRHGGNFCGWLIHEITE